MLNQWIFKATDAFEGSYRQVVFLMLKSVFQDGHFFIHDDELGQFGTLHGLFRAFNEIAQADLHVLWSLRHDFVSYVE